MPSALVVVPTYNAGPLVASVVRDAQQNGFHNVLVIDDGSTDDTAMHARAAGATILAHPTNRGKGAALRSGLAYCARQKIDWMLTMDADGQHAARDLHHLVEAAERSPRALILGVRDLRGARAPRSSRFSNAISNFFLSRFTGLDLRDTQCGLRLYPVAPMLELGLAGTGYEFEAEAVLRAARARIPIVQVPTSVHYPPPSERVSHFRIGRDVPRIIVRVLQSLAVARKQTS